MNRVFVYGTLKRGEPNHHWLDNRSNGIQKFIGEGCTKATYPLVIATKYNIPFLLDAPSKGHNVRGEIYEVDGKMLSKLDELEDHPDFYVRRLEEIYLNSSILECWTYFLPKFKPEMLERKMLISYSNTSPDCLPYLERYKMLRPNTGHRRAETGVFDVASWPLVFMSKERPSFLESRVESERRHLMDVTMKPLLKTSTIHKAKRLAFYTLQNKMLNGKTKPRQCYERLSLFLI